MPAGLQQNVVALELEKVRDKVPITFEREDILLNMIEERGESVVVSGRLMRLPLQLIPGGQGQAFNPDAGDMGRGSFTGYDVAQITPKFYSFAIEYSKLLMWATNQPQKAVANAVQREMENATKQFATFLDKLFQTSGNGVIGTIAPGGVAGQTLTMAVPFGAALVYDNQTVQVYDTTLTINRGSFRVGSHDQVIGQTITADPTTPLPGGTIAGDVLVYAGLAGAQPAGMLGLKYHQNNATTGTWLNLNRATYPFQLRTNRVNGGAGALVPQFYRLAYNFIRKSLGSNESRGNRNPSKLIAYMNVEQEAAWENLAITTSTVIKEGAGGRANQYDGLFSGNLQASGVPFKTSTNADQTRIDILDLSHWGRAVMLPVGLVDWGGQTTWPIYAASGGLSAAEIFYLATGFEPWVDSPRHGAFVDNLSRPSGY
jgi:hypothetical protein